MNTKKFTYQSFGNVLVKRSFSQVVLQNFVNFWANPRFLFSSSDKDKISKSKTRAGSISGAITDNHVQYDLIIIGAGSAGTSCAIEAAGKYKANVALVNWVLPTPMGSMWGIGGTDINTGCIPKKIFHRAALLQDSIKDSASFGLRIDLNSRQIDWKSLVASTHKHVLKLEEDLRANLRDSQVNYYKYSAEFIDKNTLKLKDDEGDIKIIIGRNILIATGGRSKYLKDVVGAREEDKLCSIPEDLFYHQNPLGKTLVIGSGNIGVEIAGFLSTFGFETSLMYKSKFLHGVDHQISKMIKKQLKENGVTILKDCTLEEIKKKGNKNLVTYKKKPEKEKESEVENESESESEPELVVVKDSFDTVILALGKSPNLPKGVEIINLNPNTRKIIVNSEDRTSVKNIFALGEVVDERPELYSIAVQAGKLLARRLFDNSKQLVDCSQITKNILTVPFEYATIGLTEEEALSSIYDKMSVEIYQKSFCPIECLLNNSTDRENKSKSQCFVKLIYLRRKGKAAGVGSHSKIVGMHYFGPNASEIISSYSIAFKLNATKKILDSLINLHPTNVAQFAGMSVNKLDLPSC